MVAAFGMKFCIEVILEEDTHVIRAVTARADRIKTVVIANEQFPDFRIGIIGEPSAHPKIPIIGLLKTRQIMHNRGRPFQRQVPLVLFF